MLPGTQGGRRPFWSPDGRSLGFFGDGKVKRIAVAGGPPQVICDVGGPFGGGAWNRHDVIVFSGADTGPLYRVDAHGGKPQPVTKLGAREEAHRWPQFLPDDEHFIFLGDAARTEDHHIKVGSLGDGSSRDLMQAVTNAIYAEPDQLPRTLQAFRAGGEELACVQARLCIDNSADSWLARLAEYAGQFDVFLPGLAALPLPLPLGGSSNHFRGIR